MRRYVVVGVAVVTMFATQGNLAVAQLDGTEIPGTEVNSVADISTSPVDEARAYYEAATGDIYTNINGTVLLVRLFGAPFTFGGVNRDTPLGGFEQFDSGVGHADFSGLANGTFNLGNLLEADPNIRTAADFRIVFPNAFFSSGAPGVDEVRSFISVIAPASAIPEPGSLSLMAVASLGLATRRRR